MKPSDSERSDRQLSAVICAMYVGAEIASSPMAAINQLGPICVVSDFGNNAGLLVGPKISDWKSRSLDSLSAKVTVDGVVVGNASANAIPGGPLQALRFLIDLCARRGIELPKGTLISTGAATGIHNVSLASRVRLDFSDVGYFDVAFGAMSPKPQPTQLRTNNE